MFRRRELLWILLLVSVGAFIRAQMLVMTGSILDSDEAIVGLMGRHVAVGHKWPIFYYGQNYMGSLEGILAGFLFWLLGTEAIVLKLVPFLFSLAHIVLVYVLGYLVGGPVRGRLVGVVAASFVSVAPSALILWSTMARGGFMELVVLGTLALILTVRVLQGHTDRITLTSLGLTLGVGWWVNNQMLFYGVAIGLTLVVAALLKPGEQRSRQVATTAFMLAQMVLCFASFALIFCAVASMSLEAAWWWYKRYALAAFGAGLVAYTMSVMLRRWEKRLNPETQPSWGLLGVMFFVGGAPWWYWNLVHGPFMVTIRELLDQHSPEEQGFIGHAQGLFENALPIIFGARRFWADADVMSFGTAIAWSAGLVLVAGYLLNLSRTAKPERGQRALLGVFCLVTVVIFCASNFGWLSKAPRYLLPLYSALPVILALGVVEISSLGKLGMSFGTLAFSALLGLNIVSQFYGGVALAGQPFVHKGNRVQEDHTELYRWLSEHRYQHIYTNYWIGYRVAFDTNEQITFSRYAEPQSLRIPEYEKGREREPLKDRVFVLVASQVTSLVTTFRAMGWSCRSTQVSGYTVLDKLTPTFPVGPRIASSEVRLESQHGAASLPALMDDRLETRWGSATPKRSGLYVDVIFREPTDIVGLDIFAGRWTHDQARGLVIQGRRPNSDVWEQLLDSGAMPDFAKLDGYDELFFEPRVLQALRIIQIGEHPVFDWSIAELHVFRAAKR